MQLLLTFSLSGVVEAAAGLLTALFPGPCILLTVDCTRGKDDVAGFELASNELEVVVTPEIRYSAVIIICINVRALPCVNNIILLTRLLLKARIHPFRSRMKYNFSLILIAYIKATSCMFIFETHVSLDKSKGLLFSWSKRLIPAGFPRKSISCTEDMGS
jgi:hypothetical protein